MAPTHGIHLHHKGLVEFEVQGTLSWAMASQDSFPSKPGYYCTRRAKCAFIAQIALGSIAVDCLLVRDACIYRWPTLLKPVNKQHYSEGDLSNSFMILLALLMGPVFFLARETCWSLPRHTSMVFIGLELFATEQYTDSLERLETGFLAQVHTLNDCIIKISQSSVIACANMSVAQPNRCN